MIRGTLVWVWKMTLKAFTRTGLRPGRFDDGSMEKSRSWLS